MISRETKHTDIPDKLTTHSDSTYGARYFDEPIPKFELPASSMPANVAYQLIHDELNLDGNPKLNLASFVTTWMEPEAEKLIVESLNKNFVDQEEYPQTMVIQDRCVSMLARLFNSPTTSKSVGTAAIGSSEAIMLAGLAAKWNWKQRRQAEGKPTDKPNIVMGIDVQVVWDKFARYFEVEPRLIPMEHGKYIITPDEVKEYVDENTIAVVAILGSTFTGEFEPVKEICEALDDVEKERGLNIPVHVDAASGGFVAPFTQPDLPWDFRNERVKSINVSGHKFGLVYPGVGWVLWREEKDLPEDLVFHVNYLGGDLPTFNLNFSRGSSHIIAQYYNFLRLGRDGYTRIMKTLMNVTDWLDDHIRELDRFELLSDNRSLPVSVFRLKDTSDFNVFHISEKLRERGWIVPAYTLPDNVTDEAVLRVVVREGFSHDLAEMLADDLRRTLAYLDKTKPAKAEGLLDRADERTRGIC